MYTASALTNSQCYLREYQLAREGHLAHKDVPSVRLLTVAVKLAGRLLKRHLSSFTAAATMAFPR